MKKISDNNEYLPFRRYDSHICATLLLALLFFLLGFIALAIGAENPIAIGTTTAPARPVSSASQEAFPQVTMPLPIFPGAQGFGTATPAGRGGRILKVTNLNDSGPGSLRAAIDEKVPRIIVFEVGGTITLSSSLRIRRPFVTIAGQTAPSPGITLKGAGLTVKSHDVLIQHLRIRVGDDPGGPNSDDRDALKILGSKTYNVVVDHVSASWGIDENISTWYGPHEVTISHSIVSEGLHVSLKKEPHSKGILVGDHSVNICLIGNLMAHNAGRNPRIKGGSTVLVVNNVVFNGAEYALMEIGSDAGPALVSAVGNIFIDGPGTPPGNAILVKKDASPGTTVYLSDNLASRKMFSSRTSFDPRASTPPVWHRSLLIRNSREVESWALSNAGARPVDRDSVDKRMVRDVKARSGRIINSQEEVGGWSVHKQTFRPFKMPASPHNDDDGDGYTNIEETLHLMASEVEGGDKF